jgi:multidrug resistance efflux pump
MHSIDLGKRISSSMIGKRLKAFFARHPIDPRRRILILLVLLVLCGLAVWSVISQRLAARVAVLQASGTVESVTVVLAPELSGRMAEVMVEKGQTVKTGEPLFRLDGELLQAQRGRAAAALEAAQANLETAEVGLISAEAALKTAQVNLEAARAAAEAERQPVQKALDDLYLNAPAARGEAARRVADANRAVRDAQYLLFNYNVSSLQVDLTPTGGLSLTQKLLDEARAAFDPYRYESEYDDRREDLKEAMDEAQSEYDSAVRRIELEAGVEAAQSQLHKAEEDLSKLEDGPNPQDVAILEARLTAIDVTSRQAEAALESAQVGVDTAHSRLKAADAALLQGQAELDLIDVQVKKLTVVSPIDGVVLNQIVEVGEVVQVGTPVMTVGRLSTLKITVYLPEDQYGEIMLGQEARVTVDSFPGQEFPATVVYIADQAEYTPRNVQTVEGRRNTVFAIELKIENADGKLKPGMPADVDFEK